MFAPTVRLLIPVGQTLSRVQLLIQYNIAPQGITVVNNIVGTGAWQEVILPTITTDPARTISFVLLQITKDGPAVFALNVDGADVRIDESLDDYIDGSLGAGYAWTGTAHNSTSTRSGIVTPDPLVPPLARRGGTNRQQNPSAETNTTGTFVANGAAVTRSNEHAWAGSWSYKVDMPITNAAVFHVPNAVLTGLTLTGVPHLVTAKLRAWIPVGITVSQVILRVNYSDATNSQTILSNVAGTNGWQELTLPPNAADPAKTISTVQLYVNNNGAQPAAYSMWLDGYDLRIDEPATDTYLDGDQGAGYAWTGTAHGSTSTRTAIVVPEVPSPFDTRAGKNWCTNPSAEVSAADITALGSATLTRTPENALFGANAIKVVTHPATPNSGASRTTPAQPLGTTPGSHIARAKLRAWVAPGVTQPTTTLTVTYTAATGGGTATLARPGIAGTGAWQTIEIGPITTDSLKAIETVTVQVDTGATPRTIVYYVDAVDIRLDEPDVDSYIDGDQGSRYGWTGTAGLSPSTRSKFATPISPPYGGGQIPTNPDAPWRDGPGISELSVLLPGETVPTKLDCAGVSCSWQVEGQAALSAEVATNEVLQDFHDVDLRGKWLYWEHPTLGRWAGEISDCEASTDTQTTEIAARDFSALLSARRIAKVYDVNAAPAGSLAVRVVRDAGREAGAYTWITDIHAEEAGPPITLTLRARQVDDALRTLSSQSGEEWWVDEFRELWWTQHRGRDLTGTVQLVEGRHVSAARYSLALDALVNDLLAIPADEQYKISEAFVVDNDPSIRKYGRRQDQIVYPGFVTESTLRPLAQRDLARLLKLGDTVRFEVANVDGCFAWFREGDSILVLLPSINRRLRVRVMVRSYDSERALLSVSGDVEDG